MLLPRIVSYYFQERKSTVVPKRIVPGNTWKSAFYNFSRETMNTAKRKIQKLRGIYKLTHANRVLSHTSIVSNHRFQF